MALTGFITAGFIGNLNESSPPQKWVIFLTSLVTIVVSIAFVTSAVQKYYRCPACGKVPTSGWFQVGTHTGHQSGVLLNPKKCPGCGVRLSENA